MKISVITVTYNSAETIKDCLNSVLAQSSNIYEHIVVDGLSKDPTVKVVNSYKKKYADKKIKLKVISEKDSGLYDAMNKGISLAQGDVVGILNSDDLYASKDIIKKVKDVFLSKKIDTLYGDLVYVKKNDTNKIVRYWCSGKFNKKRFYAGWMPPHPTFFVKKDIYIKYGLFNLSLPLAADYEIMLRFLLRYGVSTCYIPLTFVKMRLGGVSNKNIKNLIINYLENKKAWQLNFLKPRFYTIIMKRVLKLRQYF